MAGMLNIGLTGLNAAQAQLNTTSHNINNAGTPGFNRQVVTQTTNSPLFSGAGFFGQGARISSVTRQYNEFLSNQVLSADNRRAEYSAYNGQISQINNLLADTTAGLSPALQQFFAGVQEVAANPSSIPARQALISSAESMVERFRVLDRQLTEVRQGVEGQLGATVDSINVFADKIAELNQRIVIAESAGSGMPANDLRDQRDQLIAELNQLVKTSTVEDAQGRKSVYIGSGQPLVLGSRASRLSVEPGANDPTRGAVSLVAPNGNTTPLPERLITGGELGGLLAFRREALDDAQNQIGLIAISLAAQFNSLHEMGVDLDGVAGQAFFNLPAIGVRPAGSVDVALDPDNLAGLTASDYELSNTGSGFTLRRLTDGQTFNYDATDFPVSIDGLVINASTLAAGETALIQPTRFAARDIAVAVSDPRRIAAGLPGGAVIAAQAASGNAGNGQISIVTQIDPDADPIDISLAFDDATGTLTVPAGFTLTPATYDPDQDGGVTRYTLTGPDGESFEFRISGELADGDSFQLASTTDRVSDNRNAIALAALQTDKTMLGGTANFQSAYSQLVTSIGNKTREVQVGEQTQDSLLRQATEAREALSGVNLDEEAANLIRYQQAYQAAGRVMSIAQRLFDELIAIGR